MAKALGEINPNTMTSNEDVPKKKNNKRLSVERIYQKKTQLEHIILRPDSYIGSVEPCTQNMWIWDDEAKAIISKNITYTPGLYKIFDEIIVNSADNKQRDMKMNTIKVNIDVEQNIISIWNNGKGIPIEVHKEEKLYVPSMIFGHLLTSSNYNDTEKKVVGGRNGFGAKLCNIFSTKFTVETATEGKRFKQVWKKNMSKPEPEKISEYSGTDFTCITFSPDLAKFKMEVLDADFVALLKRRAYDMAGVAKGVSVVLNGEKIKIKTFKDYVGLYLKGAQLKKPEELEMPKIIHEVVNQRWEVCCTLSESGFQQSSFVNSIATTKGGTHMNYLVDQICDKLIAAVKKKTGKGGFNIKPFQVKSHLWIFANTLIENPSFDSQTKENMTLRKSSFGSTCELPDKFIKDIQNCGILDNIMSWVKFKSDAQLNKKGSSGKHSRLKGVPKLDDANDAGTKYSRDCTLIITEGDSAKALAMAGLSVVGRDRYGVFPLKGKPLNVRDASHKQIHDNAEITNLLKIIGLQFGKKYESEADMKSLRYGHLMIMADQDQDGSHIKGLVINFIHANWPGLLKLPFLEQFITPIVKVTKGSQSLSFFSIPEFEEWKSETSNQKSWRVKYYKGLGTSTSKEGKEYFSNLRRHRIVFEYDGPSSDQALIMAFSKKCVNDRKNWLTNGLAERKMRKEAGLPEMYLYEKGTRSVTYQEFVNKELILFSNTDNERSIPSLVDGLKPGQRKVLFTCFKRNDKHEIKVAQLAGSVSEQSAYHHGEMSLMGTIVNLAQNYVGSNNLNILVPHGQFGTRHMGGKDSASPRYICTMLSSLTRLVFPVNDDFVLTFLQEDNQRIEPNWYCPIIPMCLINGADGIGTGYSTKIPNYDIRDIVANVRRLIDGEEPKPMIPSYKNFTGEFSQIDSQKYNCQGIINVIDETTLEITELPVRTWTQMYKEQVMDVFLYGSDKVPACITDYREYHTDTTVKFVVTMSEVELAKAEQQGLHKKFKLESSVNTSCMVLFDQSGCLKKFENVTEILKTFYEVRKAKYDDRKQFLLGMLEAECAKMENQARFILEKIEGKIVIENRSKRDVITTLVERRYLSDPVKAWKVQIDQNAVLDDESDAPVTDVASSTSTSSGGPDFQYLLTMSIMSLSKEKKDELLRQRDQKKGELETLRETIPSDMWIADLDALMKQLEIVEEQELIDEEISSKLQKKGGSGNVKKGRNKPKKPVPKSKDITTTFEKKVKEESSAFEEEAKKTSKENLKQLKDAFDFESDTKSETASLASENSQETNEGEVLSLAERLKRNLGGGGTKKKQTVLSFNKPKKTISKVTLSDGDDDDDKEIDTFSSDEEKPKKKRVLDSDDDDDSDFNPYDKKDDFVEKRNKSIKKRAAFEDSDDSDNAEVAETRALIERLSPMKKKKPDSGSSDEPITLTDSPVKIVSKKIETKAKRPELKKKGGNSKTKEADSKQSKISFSRTKAAPKPVAKRPMASDEVHNPVPKKTKGVALKRVPSDSDSAGEVIEVPKKTASKSKAVVKPKPKKARKQFSDDDDESFSAEIDPASAPARKRGGGRATATKKTYKFSSDEEDNDDDDDDDDDDFC